LPKKLDKEEIISQGYLEAYLTGDLTKGQEEEVARWISNDADVRKAYLDLQHVLEEMSFAYAENAPQKVKYDLKAGINLGEQNRPEKRNTVLLKYWQLTAAASIVVATLLGVSAYDFWSKWSRAEAKWLAEQRMAQQMLQKVENIQAEQKEYERLLNIATNPNYEKVLLKGTENAPNSAVTVFWNAAAQEVYLSANNMQQLSTGQQYQLWALVDGVPVNAGVFDPEAAFVRMKNVAQADAFAVTIEPAGGSSVPDLPSMQVVGEVS